MRRLTQIPAGGGRSCVPGLLYASGAAVGPPSFLVLLVKDQLHPGHGPPVGGGRDGLLDGGTHTHLVLVLPPLAFPSLEVVTLTRTGGGSRVEDRPTPSGE